MSAFLDPFVSPLKTWERNVVDRCSSILGALVPACVDSGSYVSLTPRDTHPPEISSSDLFTPWRYGGESDQCIIRYDGTSYVLLLSPFLHILYLLVFCFVVLDLSRRAQGI